jgi:hypothetical protein
VKPRLLVAAACAAAVAALRLDRLDLQRERRRIQEQKSALAKEQATASSLPLRSLSLRSLATFSDAWWTLEQNV